jgi:hypothetical protein
MKKNQKGFSVVEALIVLLVISFMGGVGWYVWQKNSSHKKPPVSNAKPTNTFNSSIRSITNGLDLELINVGSVTAELDDNDKRHEYPSQSVMFFMDEPVDKNYQQLIQNLDSGGWLIDGEKASDLPFVKEAKETETTPLIGMSLLTANLFGKQDYFQTGGHVAYFSLNQYREGIKNTTESDWEYEIRSSVPAPDGFDYKTKLFDVLRANPNKVLFTVVASN